jgi:WD40 repeat protein
MSREKQLVILPLVVALGLTFVDFVRAEELKAHKEKPLREADVLKLVELQKEESDILARLEKSGVDFLVDEASLARLRKAGASEAVLAALRGKQDAFGNRAAPVEAVRSFTIKGHTNVIHAVAFSPDGKWIATGSADKTIRIWNAATGERKDRISHTDPIYCLSFSPDGKTLASGGADKAITLWDVASGEKKKTLKEVSSAAVAWIRFAPDGRTLAVFGVGKQVANVWSLSTGKQVAYLQGHTDSIKGLEFSRDGLTIATVSDDSTVRLWDAASGKEKDSFRAHDGAVNCLAFTRDGKLVTGGSDKTIIVWNLQTGNVMKPVLEGHSKGVVFVGCLPDGRILSRAFGGGTSLWRFPASKPTVIRKDFEGVIAKFGYYFPNDIALSADGKTFAFGDGNEVSVQDLSTQIRAAK